MGNKSKKRRSYTLLKRGLDIVLSVGLLAALGIPMLLIWVAVRLDSRGAGIFRQVRIGRNGRPFVCYKFRTMYEYAPHSCPSSKLSEAQEYVTPIGRILRRTSLDELPHRILRRTSLDELPQLFNVLKGDMSLVGPRPLIIEEGDIHLQRRAMGVYELRPGITGLSQVSGRNAISDELKARLDRRYLEEFGLMQDVRILSRTVGRVISGDGVDKKE